MTDSTRETATVTISQVAKVIGVPSDLLSQMSLHGVAPEIQSRNGVRVMLLCTAHAWIQRFPFQSAGRASQVSDMQSALYNAASTRQWRFTEGGKR